MPRLLLKLSGEALAGAGQDQSAFGIDPGVLERISAELKIMLEAGTQIAVVLGGGNIFRGQALAQRGLDRVMGDRMGMLATVMNGIALSDFLTQIEVPNQLFSAAAIDGVVQGYERNRALDALSQSQVVILCGGTGNPFFTTDTAACLRGIELGVDAVLKATNIDGVYTADPKHDSTATKYDAISYDEVIARELKVMDMTAIVLCKENAMPLLVFDLNTPGALASIAETGVDGMTMGTRVHA